MIGLELGGRYEIISRIGGGGMALVYKGHDILLNRKVAVKVLRQQFVHDEEFIRRFRREAQSAASLSHPNVVSIYDVGQEDEIHYIVMEYIDGHNLNEIIQERAPLQAEESVRVASQICDALEHAHQNHIIHRDIKPHNILIGKNGRVKVTDFGIARAVTSSTITQTGSVIGSVHYFSPEHAKGVVTGEKSDLYSLGIVLYQMLTARLPFLGESPISVALKHLQEQLEEPRRVNPSIPQSVENVILKAMRKNPEERYQSATEMLKDLETCLRPERVSEPKIAFATFDDGEQTRVMTAIKPEQLAAYKAANGNTSPGAVAASSKGSTSGSPPPKKKTWVKPFSWIFGTILLLLLMWFGVQWVQSILRVPEVAVPNLTGMTLDEARAELIKSGLGVDEPPLYKIDEEVPKDVVLSYDKQGMLVRKGDTIKLTVSKGIPLILLSDYEGQQYKDVKASLIAQGVQEELISDDQVFSDEEAGTIVGQSIPANQEMNPKKDALEFTVSKGRETFKMPNLIGFSEAEAKAIAIQNNLRISDANVKSEPSYSPKGVVFRQWPYEPNQPVAENSEVTIYVSSGYPSDALFYTFNVTVSPAILGQESTVKIVYSDARGDNMEWGTKKLKDVQTYPVELVLSPTKDGVISIYRDGKLADSATVSYDGAVNGDQPTMTIPGAEAEPVQGAETPSEEVKPPAEGTTEPPAAQDNGKGKGKDKNKDKKNNDSNDNEDD
ncbi:serine/threonine protein kinase [Paenibacillus swuensis]|uniref:Serine/threonine-protein kinase PrkC n=1 Tax=Paenibacillus swuensis TaxID=1178515 RepID=A0A172TL30_9BACL|nr:Stk1 family PASTA domain-containing Ser/Thr kinase [Paenibacillus swuensis]ANE47483.1 serine/threonine protein kinase [Paenibacillus swuensis]